MTQTLTVQNPKIATLRGLIDSPFVQEQLAQTLPKHIKPDDMASLVMSAVSNDAKLMECEPKSILRCMMFSSQFGLPPGPFGLCYYIPYGKEAKFIPGYKGALQLIRNTNDLEWVIVEAVHTEDEFHWEFGLEPKLQHKPSQNADRGTITHYYCAIRMRSGEKHFKVMSVPEIEAHRNEFSEGYKYAERTGRKDSTWHKHFGPMACKTVLLKTAKLCPISRDSQNLIAVDEAAEAGLPQPAISLSTISIPDLSQAEPSQDGDKKKPRKRKLTTSTKAVVLPGYIRDWGNRPVSDPDIPLMVLVGALSSAEKRLDAGYAENRKEMQQQDQALAEALQKTIATRQDAQAPETPATEHNPPSEEPKKAKTPSELSRERMEQIHVRLIATEAGKSSLYKIYDNFCINDWRAISEDMEGDLLDAMRDLEKVLKV